MLIVFLRFPAFVLSSVLSDCFYEHTHDFSVRISESVN